MAGINFRIDSIKKPHEVKLVEFISGAKVTALKGCNLITGNPVWKVEFGNYEYFSLLLLLLSF